VTAPPGAIALSVGGPNSMALAEPQPRRAPLITFMFVRSATPHLSVAAEQQSGNLTMLAAMRCAAARRPGSSSK
jgi:hypothetical protein